MHQLALLNKNYNFYKKQYNYNFIAGIDEVGRGPLVGAVIAAAVILPAKYKIDYLTDSKKITEKQRIIAYNQIKDQAVCYALGRAEASEIDSINILQASLLAMLRALENLAIKADAVLIDGNKIPKDIQIPAKAVIKGDLYEDVISAASIIAKVTRDREMIKLDKSYPQYGFAQHKGYPTKQHITAIQTYGIISEHRKSFGPVRSLTTA